MYQPKESWKALCEQAVAEPDGDRLLEIVAKLNQVLDERAIGGGTTNTSSQQLPDASKVFYPKDSELVVVHN